MANVPLVNANVKITSKDINGNSIQKTFNNVSTMVFDYQLGRLNIVDTTGSFYFSLTAVLTLTYTVVSGYGGSTSIVIA